MLLSHWNLYKIDRLGNYDRLVAVRSVITCNSWGVGMTQYFALQLKDYRLTTAEILYRMPDHRELIQTFIWQDLDIAPEFPVLHKFLDFWQRNIEGPLFKVRVASAGLIQPAEYRFADVEMTLH